MALSCYWSKLKGARRVIAIDRVPERLALAKNVIGCDIIDFSVQTGIVSVIYELEPQGVDYAADASGFRYAETVLHEAERAINLETNSSGVVNEALPATGHVSLVADYATTNQFLIGALMEKDVTCRGCGQALVQKYWHQLLAKIEKKEFDPTVVLTTDFRLRSSRTYMMRSIRGME